MKPFFFILQGLRIFLKFQQHIKGLALKDVLSIEYKQRQQRRSLKEKDQILINLLMRKKLDDAIAEDKE